MSPDRRGRLHGGANALLKSAGADGGCRSVDVGAPFHASSLEVKGGSDENVTWRDVRRRVEPSSSFNCEAIHGEFRLCASHPRRNAFSRSDRRVKLVAALLSGCNRMIDGV